MDTLHTDDIKAYIQSHYGVVDRVEWIDDKSANLVFSSEGVARDALSALSAVEVADVTALAVGETLPAKALQGKPDVTLHVRLSVQADKKQAGAALRSRYYLLHPEFDPEERRRRQQDTRSRYRDRDGDRGRDSRRRRRDSDEEVVRFEASMYDDAPRPAKEERQRSNSGDRRRSFARENRGKELFASRNPGRDRSASPMRHGEDDVAMGDRPSSSQNRAKARSIRGRLSAENTAKELFPTKSSSGRGGQLDQLERAIGSARLKEEDRPKVVAVPNAPAGSAFNIRGIASQRAAGDGFSIKGAASARELFPGRFGGSNVGKELLDATRSKPRQKAEDLFS